MPRKGGVPENLKPAKKGEVRNPKGRPKGTSKVDMLRTLREMLQQKRRAQVGGIRKTYTIEEIIVARWVEKAASGNAQFLKMMVEQLHGYPTAKHEIEGNIGFTMEEMLERAKRHEDVKRNRSKKRPAKRKPKK